MMFRSILLMCGFGLLAVMPLTFADDTPTKTSETNVATTPTPVSQTLTPFKISYRSEWHVGWFSFDIDASRTLKKLDNGEWELVFDAEASVASLRETSQFTFVDGRILPNAYKYRASGLIDEDDRTLTFKANDQTVFSDEKNKLYTDQWQDDIQDNITYMLQASVDLASGQTEFEYPVFEKKNSKPFRFKVVGEEVLKTPAGKFRAVKVEQLRSDKRRQIFAWFAIDQHYALIRMTDKKDGKTRYQIDATKLEF
ncbi:DUF3108 domain-containing protein [Thalassolituus oleivorans]|uniref:Dehydrogenase n=1 Tax=Thalassolituus oleivorans MIL-1 TaxID=1298593 RepID=M5E5B4_9GAMM|nr:DUF3108 domain-containing protein [Thalassolituus oleivorans]CCU72665.1 hypothetical protein TOL_2262 [Thalassolituus oleivorans MIL-1]